jgi:hypothetical protein
MSSDRKGFPALIRDAIKLFALWPDVDDATLQRFAKDSHRLELTPADLAILRDTTGMGNERFRLLGRKVCEWVCCQQLGCVGYNGRTLEKLVAACSDAANQILVSGKTSPLLISEWVQDFYDELSVYQNQPMRYRLLAAEKAQELKELLQCESLPKISLRA